MRQYIKSTILVLCLMTLVMGAVAQDLAQKVEIWERTPDGYRKAMDYAQILEDTDIMSKIIDKTLEKKWPKKYEPSTLFRQSLGCQGVYLKGYGIVFITNINFPVAEREKTCDMEVPTDDLWQQTRSELRGATGVTTVTYARGGEEYDAQRVGSLKEELLTVIGEYGPNIRQLSPRESVVIVVRGAAGTPMVSISGYYPRAPAETELHKLEGKLEKMEEQLNDAGEPGTEMTHEVKEPSDVTFKIRNVNGRLVRTLNVGHKEPGIITTSWDGRNDTGKAAKAGVYIYEVTAGGDTTIGKVIMTKPPRSVAEDSPGGVVGVRWSKIIQVSQALNFTKTGGSTTGRTTMIIKVSKKNIDAYKDGNLDFEDFAEKAEITQY